MNIKQSKDKVREHVSRNQLKAGISKLEKLGGDVGTLKEQLAKLEKIKNKAAKENRLYTGIELHTYNTIHEGLVRELLKIIDTL